MDAFLQYLNHPDDPAGILTRDRLNELIRRYPWFTTARIVRSRMEGTVDPVLTLRLMVRPAPDLLLRGTPMPAAYEQREEQMPVLHEQQEEPMPEQSGLPEQPLQAEPFVPAEQLEQSVQPERIKPLGQLEQVGSVDQAEEPKPVEVSEQLIQPEQPAEVPDGTIEVIDRFLALPQVRIVPKEGVPEGDLSAASAEGDLSDDDLVSEELAEIYLAQGLTARAKEIYGKLSLLYPEKSVYFAEIISRIECETAE